MKPRHVATSIILALASCLAIPARPQQKPLTKEQVVNLVKNQLGEKTGARSIEQRGIDFDPSPAFLESLKDAGAEDVFILALKGSKRASSPAKNSLSQVQILVLLGGQVASHRVALLVEQRGIDFDPKDDALAEISRAGGDEELLRALRRATVIKPRNVDPAAAATEAKVREHVARAAELNQKGQYAEGEQEIRSAIKLWPESATLHANLASALQGQGKWDESIPVLREAVRLDPSNSRAHIGMGVALGSKQDVDGAISEFREALRLDPGDDNTHYNMGVALMMKGDADGAMAQYREALRLNPKNDAAHYGLGKRLEFDKHDRRGALEEYRAAYDLVPTNATYKSNYERLKGDLNQ